MAPVLEQSSYNSVAKYESRTCTATFSRRTKPGSLVVVVCLCAGALPVGLHIRDTWWNRFDRIGSDGLRDLEMAVWYTDNAPSMSQVTVGYNPLTMRSIQMRIFEYSGVAQANALDDVQVRRGENRDPYTGTTDWPDRGDSLALAFIANQYASTTQYGFRGNLTRMYESTSPLRWGGWWGGTNQDWERSRMTVHQAIVNDHTRFSLDLDLSTTRRWICILAVFRGGSLGPINMTATNTSRPMIQVNKARADLTCFGPLQSTDPETITTIRTGITRLARIGPSNYQYRLGGWTGLLIGSGTDFHVEGTEGLGGMEVRTSDDDLPRGDGALRGIDLETARQMVFRMNVGKGRANVELNMDTLMRALRPQRDEDWELIWRHPTQPLKMMRVRPTAIMRNRDNTQLFMHNQAFTLRAADPRHYGAIPKEVRIQNSTNEDEPIISKVVNIGNLPAYPIITFRKTEGSQPVTKIQLVNATALVTFEVQMIIQTGSQLVADMEAHNTGVPRSIITLDGQSKYGSWQLPRDPFRIEPDPEGFGAFNEIYMITEPVGAPIECIIQYRDTWSG